jgi:hypothetical protein
LTAAATATGADQDDAKPAAASVNVKEPAIDDTDELLHITRRSGQVVLREDPPVARLELEFYQNGKKLPFRTLSVQHSDRVSPLDKRTIDFSVQAIDLDWLKLDSGPKGHHRVLLKLKHANNMMTMSGDVPKDLFDFSKNSGWKGFTAAAGSANEVPLFCWLSTDTNTAKGGMTVQDMITLNPQAKLAIAYLRLTERK